MSTEGFIDGDALMQYTIEGYQLMPSKKQLLYCAECFQINCEIRIETTLGMLTVSANLRPL